MSSSPFTTDPLLDGRLGNYRIIRPLGAGGMSRVYLAHDETLKRLVALKVIHEDYREQEEYRDRLISEATAIAALKHPNIIQIYTAGEHEGILFFAMEMINGKNLKEMLNDNLADGGTNSFEGIIKIGDAIAAALDYAHAKGVIHQDVKPANVLITPDNHVYLTDFGLAVDVRDYSLNPQPEFVGGTPQYMSPEQIDSSHPVGPASDQYALGIILFEMFAGTVPFDGDDPEAIYQKHLNNPPPKPSSLNRNLPTEIQEVLLRALSKHLNDRYESCAAFIKNLSKAWETAQATLDNQRISLPALPAGTRARHGLPLVKVITPHDQKTRNTDPPLAQFDPRVSESTRLRPIPPTTPLITRPQKKSRDDRYIWMAAGVVGTVLIILAIYFGLNFINRSGVLGFAPPSTPTLTPPLPLTPTSFPTATPPPPSPTSTSSPTLTLIPPTLTPSSTPTLTEVAGDPFLLVYDDGSFYLINLSIHSRNISLLEFERLDFSDAPLEFFNGLQWARFNEIIRPGTCMRIKISGATSMEAPEECHGTFDAEITISPSSESDFWTIQVGSSYFRVLWSGVEIKRCSTILRTCDLNIP